MTRLTKKLKLNRIISMFLVLNIVLSTFLTSIASSTVSVSADSNDRRSALMNLASSSTSNKTTINTIDDVANIDETSLRVIALYLTNFYVPWVSSIDSSFDSDELSSDSDSSNSDSKKTVSQDYKDNMVTSLKENCGFDKTTAGYIVDYIIQENLSTCQEIYVKSGSLESIWNAVDGAMTYADKVSPKASPSAGFFNRRFLITDDELQGWGIKSDSVIAEDSTFSYNSFDDYKEYFGTKTYNSVEYVSVTYPIFLQIMDYCYRVASVDTLEADKDNKANKYIWNYRNSYDTYNISNRIDAVSSDVDIENVPLIQFYTTLSDGTMSPVFSNNEECMQAYAMVQNFVDIKNGFSSGFLAV